MTDSISSLLQDSVGWIAMHPAAAGAVVFALALAESLAVVGLAVPGAALMIAAGALVALGALDFWPTLLLAVAGAIAGDGISYWIGRRYRERLRAMWPLRRHPAWLARGEDYFHRHGGKSILFGRFVGPVRPVIPLVAGMLGMRPASFYAVNVLSALAWAPAYLLPGMAFGASLALAGQVAGRLVVLLLLLAALAFLVGFAVRGLFRILRPRAARMAEWSLLRLNRLPLARKLLGGLLDPAQPEPKALLAMGTLLLGSAWLFLGILEDVVSGDPLVRADQGLHQFMQGLRTPWGDRIMVLLTELGDGVVIAWVAASVLAWLLWRRSWSAAMYWVAAVACGQLAVTLLKEVLQRPRPPLGDAGAFFGYAFPSGHATMSMAVYGFLAVLVARTFPPPRRWLPYAASALLIGGIALSRLYLGVHWFSDVVGGLSLGLALVAVLAIAYFRHTGTTPVPRGLPGVAVLALVLAGGWHVATHHATDLERYSPQPAVRHLDAAFWWREGWRSLPAYRSDLEGEPEQPFNVQWAGTLPGLRETLRARGWREPVTLDAASALRFLLPAPALDALPLLPQVHDGRHESLLMVRTASLGQAPGESETLVLRLWQSGAATEPGGVPVWVGSVSFLGLKRVLLLEIPVTVDGYDAALAALAQSLQGAEQSPGSAAPDGLRWSGDVLLIRGERVPDMRRADRREGAAPSLRSFDP